MLKTKNKNINMTRKITECGIFMSIIIILNVAFNIYLTRIFPEGGAINISLVFVVVLTYRYDVWTASLINLVAVFIVYVSINPHSFVPPIAIASAWGIMACLFLDYFCSSFLAIPIGYYLSKIILIKSKSKYLEILLFVIIRSVFGFLFSFISGIYLWGSYAPDSQGPIIYSLIYNLTLSGGQMGFGLALSSVIYKAIPWSLERQRRENVY